jgi:hypothetical protein
LENIAGIFILKIKILLRWKKCLLQSLLSEVFSSIVDLPLLGKLLLINSFFSETGSYYIAQDGIKLKILLLQLPEHWDYRCAPIPCTTLDFTEYSVIGKSLG